MKFTIVVPLFNESNRIDKNIIKIFDFFRHCEHETELIFVNDGSSDDTLDKLSGYREGFDFQVISYEANRGKGYAIRRGVMQATGDWILFFDIDLATPLEEFNNLILALKGKPDIVMGSRRLHGSVINRQESMARVFLGQCFTKISNILVPKITDFTCGFKCFSSVAGKEIFSLARVDRWGFDTEILYIAHLRKKKILQIPVAWSHDGDSRVRVIRDVFSSLRDLCVMKWNQLRGFYN